MAVEIDITRVPVVIEATSDAISRQKPDIIIVDDQVIELDRRVWEIDVKGSGPQGPPGPPGPSAGAFVHQQVTPSDIWTVVHPFNRSVSVTVYDSTGCVVRAAVVEISPTVVEVRANKPFSGRAVVL